MAEIDHRKVYARGFYDGQRAAGIDTTGESMNEAKLAKKEEGLNSIARKVLDAVPMQDPWAKDRICGELRRIGVNAGRDAVESCLHLLRGRGLIREPQAGMFIRVEAKPKNPQPEIKIVHSVSTPKPAVAEIKPAPVQADLPTQILEVSALLASLAVKVEALALAAESEIAKAKTENALPLETMAALKTLGLIRA